MNNNSIINMQLANLVSAQQSVAAAYDHIPIEIEAMYRTFLKKSKGQPQGVINLCAEDLGFKLAEFMADK